MRPPSVYSMPAGMRNRNFKIPGQPESTGENYEHYVRQQCRAYGLPPPLCGKGKEHLFHARRNWRFDFAWLDPYWLGEGREHAKTNEVGSPKIALEVEGGVFSGGRHTRPLGFIEDCEKYSEAAILGWCVIRCVPEQIWSGEAVKRVARAFEARLLPVQWPTDEQLAAVTFGGDVSKFDENFDTSDDLW